jgi:protein-disulfide isomerase
MTRKNVRVAVLVVSLAAGIGPIAACTRGREQARSDATKTQPARPVNAPERDAAGPRMEDPRAVYRVPVDGSAARGPDDALVTVVEVLDFECPFCKQVAPTLKQVEEAYRGKVRFVFKHNPLGMHRNAVTAAAVVEEARAEGGDGRFWEARNKVLELASLDRASLERAAAALRLDAGRVKAALEDGRHIERMRRDQNLLNPLGARGTPTFFVNGRKLVGAQPLEAMKALIDEELAKAQGLVERGIPPSQLYGRIVEEGARAPVMIAAPAAAPAGAAAAAPSAVAGKVTVRPDDPAKGPAVAPVTVVLFSDFQCPFCGRVEPTLKQIEQAYPGKVRIVWKHLPLGFHPNALPAAKAAEAARAQGKFWELHDRLFAEQAALSDAAYRESAKELRLDLARFEQDLASTATAQRIAEDQKEATAAGATGTPTAFVNCRKVVGAQPFDAFKKVIDEELERASGRAARGEKIDAAFYDRVCAETSRRRLLPRRRRR